LSVTKLREATEKKGCMVAVWIVMVLSAVGLAGSGFFGCFNADQTVPADAVLEENVLSVNGEPVMLGTVNRQVEFFLGLYERMGQPVGTPDLDFEVTSSSLSLVVDQQVQLQMAKQKGLTVDDETILAAISDALDNEITQIRMQAVTGGDLKENATEAEFQEWFEKNVGSSTSEYKKSRIDLMREELKKPYVRQAEAGRYAFTELQEKYFNEATATDEEIKRSFDKLMVLKLTFDNVETPLAEREAQAKKALAEIKGGADFATVQTKYMKNPVNEPAGLLRSDVEADPAKRPLASLKPGQTSEVLMEFGVPTIYKLLEVKSEAPTDIETNRDVYGQTVRREKAGKALQVDFDKARDAAKIEWESESFKAIFDVFETQTDDSLSDEQKKQVYLDVMAQGEAPADDPAGPKANVLAKYAAMKRVETMLTADERKERLQDFAMIIAATLDQYESTDLRLKLVDIYSEAGDYEQAAAELLLVAQYNTGFEEQNLTTFNTINTVLSKLQTEKKISDEAALKIRDELLKWSEAKKQSEEMEKKAEEEAKKAQEELDKFTIDPKTGKPLEEGGTTGGGTGSTTGGG
jgi:hypothetical protein